ncbi:MAG: two-component regulator propeller domain-containing protein [Flavobacteriales bacterium]
MAKSLFSFLFLVFSYTILQGQRHSFISYSVKEGLAQSQVRDILQSKDGYLWIATIGGVSKFDGHNFETYNKANGLLNNVITAIYEMPDSTIIVACQGGIVSIKNGKVLQFPFPENLESSFVFDMIEDNNTLLLASNGSGIIEWDGKNFSPISIGSSNDNFIRSLNRFDNAILLGTKSSLISYDQGKFTTLIHNISVNTMTSNDDELWITTTKDGVYKITKNDTIQFTTEDGLSSMYQNDACIDKHGDTWFISKNGIIKYIKSSKKFEHIRSIDPSHDDNLKVLFSDKESNIWVGTSGAGILKYTGDKAVTFTKDDGLASEQIMCIRQQSDGKYWFATYGSGVISYDGQTFKNITFEDGLLNNTIWSLEVIENDLIWIGTSDGINIYDHGKLESFPLNDQLPFVRVSAIFRDQHNDIWIGTRDGLLRFTQGSITTPRVLAEMNLNEVKAFQESNGIIWISSSKGAYGYDLKSESVISINNSSGLEEEYVSCLAVDNAQNVWLGTDEGVFTRNLVTGKTEHIRVSPRPSSNVITFLSYYDNKLWIGSDYGLFSLDTKAYNERDSIIVTSYNEHDGIIGQECNQNASFADHSGNLWFGTNGGLIRFNPFDNSYNPDPEYTIKINDIQLNFESIKDDFDLSQHLEFDHKSNRFTIHYSTIHFANPEKVSYSYRLLGSETEWSPPVSEDYITYANLKPGSYEFQVRSKFENANWSSNYATFSFTITPPFYQRWWFIFLCIVAGMLGIYGIYLQTERERKRKAYLIETENRAKILGLEQQTLNAHMNRHFIFNALNSIQYYINTQDRKQANMYLTNFASLVRKNLDSAQSESIFLKDELERLRLYMNLEQMRFKDRFDYEIIVDENIDIEHTLVPSMILQPFVENSIMHGILPSEKKGTITIQITKIESDIQFRITDNGIGIETSVKQKNGTSYHVSNGMKITRQRMEVLRSITKKNYEVKGPMEIFGNNGNTLGTAVEITLPENNKISGHKIV